MADLKSDDVAARRPSPSFQDVEKGGFRPRSAAGSLLPAKRPALESLPDSVTKITNNAPLSILAYCLSSISMTLVNKYVVSGQFWNMTFFYLTVQAVVCIGAIMACKNLGLITQLSPFDKNRARQWFPISMLLVTMIYTGTKALQYLAVPVFTIFKNLTIIVIAYGEVLWFGGSVSPLSLLSFGLMVFSSVVAAWADIQSAVSGKIDQLDASAAMSQLNAGYAWMALNIFCSAFYALGMRKVIKKMNFKDWDTMYYNNLLTIPVLLFFSLLTEDWSAENFAKNFPAEDRNRKIMGMVYSGLTASFISYCSSWCIRVTSSTTYSMVGALNKLPIAIAGLIFFAAPVTFGSVSAIFIGFVAGLVYTAAKVNGSSPASSGLPLTRPTMSASAKSARDANS